jgi:molybdate transport system substrate-binding protein
MDAIPMYSLPRPGKANTYLLAFLGSVAILAGLVGLLAWDPEKWLGGEEQPAEPLVVYCAAGIRAPVEAVAKEYEAAYGVPVQLQYGGSQTLLAGIEVSRRGDLYIPADDGYLKSARDKGLIDETISLARMTPVIVVRRGNPKNVKRLDDLLRSDVRVAQGNPDATAIGSLTRDALRQSGHWEALNSRTAVFKMTVNDVANDIQVGAADAGIVWDGTVRQTPGVEVVPLPELARVRAHVTAAILHDTTRPTAVLKFARFLAARDRGLPRFAEHGFEPVEGDAWAEEPELKLLAGAMLRPAVEETLIAFEKREGVKVTRVYNGCGILVSQMRAGERPDAYFACDKSFMNEVADLFTDHHDVSTNQLVILVHKGNSHGIETLTDLAKPGLRVGIGHEKQCALGVLTQQTFREGRVQEQVMKNVKVQSPTGDMLVNQLRTGSLDAVVAYVSNAVPAADQLEAIAIDIPCALAVQPIAEGKESKYRHLTGRLTAALRSAESQDRFEANGFHWLSPKR